MLAQITTLAMTRCHVMGVRLTPQIFRAQLGPGASLASVVAAAAEDGGAELPAAPVVLRVREGSPLTLTVAQLQARPC